SLGKQVLERLRGQGPLALARTVARRFSRAGREAQARSAAGAPGMMETCARHGIPVVRVPGINTPEAHEAMRKLGADLFVVAGTAILGVNTLAIPTLGSLNVHSGLLPHFRGMNVAEWSA